MPIRRSGAGTTLPRVMALLGVTLFAGYGCGSEQDAGSQPNIIFISIDSLRSDHVGCYGYEKDTTPFIDSLAARGVRFENAVSTTSWTLPSHASMFTGLLGPAHGLIDNGLSLSDDHITLAELLNRAGYHTAGFFGGPYLHPAFGLGQGFDVYRSCMTTVSDFVEGTDTREFAHAAGDQSHKDITGPRTRHEVKLWAKDRAHAEGAGAYFLFIHLWDVHYDYTAPKEYEELFVDPNYSGTADGRLMYNDSINRGMSPEDLAHVLALYDAEIRYTDRIIQDILGDLEQRGLLKNTVVILTSDHGEEFFEHDNKGHNKTLFEEVLRIPLIISWPGEIETGQVVRDQVQIIDIMPTILGLAGVSAELAVQGSDLAPLLNGRRMDARDALSGLFIDGQSQRALRSNDRKVIRVRDDWPAVYVDLRSNPMESVEGAITVNSGHSQELRKKGEYDLQRALRSMNELKAALKLRPPNSIELTDEMRRKLSDLGYLGKFE